MSATTTENGNEMLPMGFTHGVRHLCQALTELTIEVNAASSVRNP